MASGAPHRDSARDGQSGGNSRRLKIQKNAPRLVLRTACEGFPLCTSVSSVVKGLVSARSTRCRVATGSVSQAVRSTSRGFFRIFKRLEFPPDCPSLAESRCGAPDAILVFNHESRGVDSCHRCFAEPERTTSLLQTHANETSTFPRGAPENTQRRGCRDTGEIHAGCLRLGVAGGVPRLLYQIQIHPPGRN